MLPNLIKPVANWLCSHRAGKTLNITQQLTTGLAAEMVPVFLTFSARTSANQTQDIIDSKMDKRRKVPPQSFPLTAFTSHQCIPASVSLSHTSVTYLLQDTICQSTYKGTGHRFCIT